MPRNFVHYSVLISCPSDILKDKKVIEESIQTVNIENAHFNGIHFDIKHWTKDVLFSHGTPQQIINNSIVYDSDIVIAVFGSKLGTPTDRYDSGTIEEIELMIKDNKQVFVCFSEKEITLSGDTDEESLENLLKVKRFKKAYNGLYITYKDSGELEDQIRNQLRLYLSKIHKMNDRSNVVCNVPFTFQELQNDQQLISNAEEIMFCARTGKIFLTGHYNLLKEFINFGGTFKFITSENLNLLYDDNKEHQKNCMNSIDFLKSLYQLKPNAVQCRIIDTPPNVSLLYVRTKDGEELIDVKFNFQTKIDSRHPLFTLRKGNPYFGIFYAELCNLWEIGNEKDIR